MDKKQYKTIWGTAKPNTKGYYVITSAKEGNCGKFLHRLIWESVWGELPKNWVVHHLDEQKNNNCILNLFGMPKDKHVSLHFKGEKHPMYGKTRENHPMYGKHLSYEARQKISESKKGENNHMYGKPLSDEHRRKISESEMKKYARIVKVGKKQNGKQDYALVFNGKQIKKSIFPEKLEKWFLKEYPLEIMRCW